MAALAAAAHIILVLAGQAPLGRVMLVELARAGLAQALAVAAQAVLVLRLLGGHQLAVMAALALRPQSQAHRSCELVVVVVVVTLLSALVEQVAVVMAAQIWAVMLPLAGLGPLAQPIRAAVVVAVDHPTGQITLVALVVPALSFYQFQQIVIAALQLETPLFQFLVQIPF